MCNEDPPGAVPPTKKRRTSRSVVVSQSVSYFTVPPPRSHPSAGSPSGSAAPSLTQVPSTRPPSLIPTKVSEYLMMPAAERHVAFQMRLCARTLLLRARKMALAELARHSFPTRFQARAQLRCSLTILNQTRLQRCQT